MTASLLTKNGNGRFDQAFNGQLRWQVTERADGAVLDLHHQGPYRRRPRLADHGLQAGRHPRPGQPDLHHAAGLRAHHRDRRRCRRRRLAPLPANRPRPASSSVRPAPTGPSWRSGKDDALVTLGQSRQRGQGVENHFDLASLALQYDFEHMTVKSITTYIQDSNASGNTGGSEDQRAATAHPGRSSAHQLPAVRLPGADGRDRRLYRRFPLQERALRRPAGAPLLLRPGLQAAEPGWPASITPTTGRTSCITTTATLDPVLPGLPGASPPPSATASACSRGPAGGDQPIGARRPDPRQRARGVRRGQLLLHRQAEADGAASASRACRSTTTSSTTASSCSGQADQPAGHHQGPGHGLAAAHAQVGLTY